MKLIHTVVGLVVGLTLGVSGTAIADGTFDNSTPPSTHGMWMDRPCIDQPTDIPKPRNCFWNDTMGLTDIHGDQSHVGFWIRRLPRQHLICWFHAVEGGYGPKDDMCYGTTKVIH